MLRSRAAPLPMLAASYKVNFAVLCWPTDVLITGAMVIAGSTQLLQMVVYVVSERYHIDATVGGSIFCSQPAPRHLGQTGVEIALNSMYAILAHTSRISTAVLVNVAACGHTAYCCDPPSHRHGADDLPRC